MVLADVKKNQQFKILSVPDDVIRAQTIRFGINSGSIVSCDEIIPAGPVIVRKNKQEIAVGNNLAKEIVIELV